MTEERARQRIDPTCRHKVRIGAFCDRCTGMVGRVVVPRAGDTFRFRSPPYGQVSVLESTPDKVTYYDGQGRQEVSQSAFAKDFWLWGSETRRQRALNQLLEQTGDLALGFKPQKGDVLTREQLRTMARAMLRKVSELVNGQVALPMVLARQDPSGDVVLQFDWPDHNALLAWIGIED